MIYLKLYLLTLQIAAVSFGGAYSIWALAEKEFTANCSENTLVCREQYQTVFAVSEILPGPQINAIAMLVHKNFGIGGMLIVIIALITPGFLLTPIFARIYRHAKDEKNLRHFHTGTVLVALSILLLFAFRLSRGLITANFVTSTGFFLCAAAAFWASYRYRLHPFAIVAASGITGYMVF